MKRLLIIAAVSVAVLTLMQACSLAADAYLPLSTRGLTVGLDRASGQVTFVGVNGKQVSPNGQPGGLYIEDVAAETGPVAVTGPAQTVGYGVQQRSDVDKLGLLVEASYGERKDHIAVRVNIKDQTGKDRAVRLTFRMPLSNKDWIWHDNILRSRKATKLGRYEFLHKHYWDVNSDGLSGGPKIDYPCKRFLSVYPFSCLSTNDAAISVGMPLSTPRVFQIGYVRNDKGGYLEIAFDLGISADVKKYRSSTDVEFVIYAPDRPDWGFRSANDGYYKIYPKDFEKRARREGIWLLALDAESIVAPWDFGFGFVELSEEKQRSSSVKYSHVFDFYSTNYIEPWGLWIGYQKPFSKPTGSGPTTTYAGIDPEEIKKVTLDMMSEEFRRYLNVSATYGDDGNWIFTTWSAQAGGWCPGGSAHLKLCMTPAIPGGYGEMLLGSTIKNLEQSRTSGPGVDGVYLDSVGAYTGFYPDNYRREQWAYAEVPLVYNTQTKKVAELHAFSNWTFVKHLSEYLQENNLSLIANIYPSCEKFFYPMLDMVGVETVGGMFGSTDGFYAYLRSYSYQKPVSWLECSLIRTVDKMSSDRLNMGFERCLAWGVYPGSVDFIETSIKSIEKLRPTYKEFTPLIKEVATAGWEPLTLGRLTNRELNVERFGDMSRVGRLYFTIYNPLTAPVGQTKLMLDGRSLGLPVNASALNVEDLRTGKTLKVVSKDGVWHVRIPDVGHEKTVVVRISTQAEKRRLRLELLSERVKRIVQTMEWLQAYPQGEDEAKKAEMVRNCASFISTSPARKLMGLIGESVDTGKPLDKKTASTYLNAVALELKGFPANQWCEAMRNQAARAVSEIENN